MNKKVSILYIVSTLGRSGPTNQLYSFIKYLDKEKFEPYILTLSPEPKDSRWDELKELKLNLASLNQSRFLGIFFGGSKLKAYVRRIEPDIIHSQGIRSDRLSSLLKTKKPRVATIHNFPQYDYLMRYGKTVGKYMLKRHIPIMKSLDMLIGVSNSVTENLSSIYNINNIVTIQNGVDTSRFFPVSQKEKEAIREKLGLPLKKKIWISTGHLSKRKDPISVIKNFKRVFENNNSHFLLLLGDGELYSECVNISSDTENIKLGGRVTNVPEYLQASNYFISASKAEGLPMAVIEAMACGLPVLLSDIGPHLEIFNLNSKAGTVFKLGSDIELQKKFKLLEQKNSELMKSAALLAIESNLNAKFMSKQYQKLYSDLLKQESL